MASRKLKLALRRQFQARRRFDVRYLGDIRFEYTCKTCGVADVDEMRDPLGRPLYGGSEKLLARFARYQQQGGGVSGVCKHCTKVERDRRWPLT